MGSVEHSGLFCSHCGKETRHELAYAGRMLVKSTCTNCGFSIGRDLRSRYVADLRQRLRSKPRRIMGRLLKDPLRFVGSLPKTVPTKPLEIISEVRLVLGSAAKAHRKDSTTRGSGGMP